MRLREWVRGRERESILSAVILFIHTAAFITVAICAPIRTDPMLMWCDSDIIKTNERAKKRVTHTEFRTLARPQSVFIATKHIEYALRNHLDAVLSCLSCQCIASMFYFKNLYQPCVCSCVTMKNIEQCIMHATPWSFGYRNRPRTFAHFFSIAIQSFPGSDCWYCGRHCCLFCLGFCFDFSREKDKSTSVNGVWVRTFTHTNTLTHLIWRALFSFWTSSLRERSLHGVHTWTRLWIYAHVYMWSICVFVFATLFNITNMRTHCVRVHNTYMWTL